MSESPEDRILDSVLSAYQLRARVTDDANYCGHWREPEPQADTCIFHLIDKGECRVEANCLPQATTLGAGDLIVFPHGSPHLLSGTSSDYTTMLCGQFDFICGQKNPLLDSLPNCIIVREVEAGTAFRRIAELLTEEFRNSRFGSRAVTDKLADGLFVMTVRHHLSISQDRRGLLGALSDPKLQKAVNAMHNHPGRDWTVASLADEAGMSRTAFAEHFTDLLGVSPIQYLTRWRMMEALKLLNDSRLSVATIAERLGYQTEAAFRRGFKRIHGYGPGQARRAK
jgi:AraC-like DNA-binding protein